MSYVQLPDRTSSDANSAADVNLLQDNIEALKGGTGSVAPTTDIETLAALVTALQSQIVPSGSVLAYAGSSAPTGWLICDGSAVSRTTYSDLFTAISTTWGVGDGSTTFNLPDLRAATLRGVGTSTIFTDNTKTVTLAETIDDAAQGHFHNVYTAGLGENAVIVTRAGVGATTSELAAGNSGTGTVDGLRIASMISNGANGTPRKGNETTGKARGVNFIIKI